MKMTELVIKELTESIQRLQADFENFQKKTDKERQNIKDEVNAEIISKLWVILDNIQICLENIKDKDAFIEAIKITFADMFNFLHQKGLTPIKSVGEKFDPHKHEALMKEGDGDKYVIIEEFQKGYMLHDRVLRPSKVKIKSI